MPIYGLVSFAEAAAIERSLLRLAQRFPNDNLQILENGIEKGRTSRGIRDWLAQNNIKNYTHWCVDLGRSGQEKPYPDVRMVWGDSAEVFSLIPTHIHWVFIDGCHCTNHVMADVAHYGNKLVPGGEMIVHATFDQVPIFQDYQDHGPRDRAEFHVLGGRIALRLLGLLPIVRSDYKFVEEIKYPTFDGSVGAIVYEKVM